MADKTWFICIKQVSDVNAPTYVREGKLISDVTKVRLNAYDASALEEALVLSETMSIKIHVVLVGVKKATETIRKALAMGADEATHIVVSDNMLPCLDSHAYALLLSHFFKLQEYDVIACGKQSQDTDSGLTGSMLAYYLKLPYATNAIGLAIAEDKLSVTRQGDVNQELIQLGFPCLVTCSNDMNTPRIPTLRGIMTSKRKPIKTIDGDQMLKEKDIVPKTHICFYENMPTRKAGKIYEGDIGDVVDEVVKNLINKNLI